MMQEIINLPPIFFPDCLWCVHRKSIWELYPNTARMQMESHALHLALVHRIHLEEISN